ncbi:hypothetical protein H7849_25200 [Alloacidobacterium dinghuense]|uniref:Calcium-binding protein n=1 Tax=Alloacidobacterium dinghuense TaxID=2763107 RepID=A0A7G8BI73_9BACT|nr:hypothetical protein [Alloacidobacterium dinghuense]QNI32243.1 hypothetical protein H7849_25200 [Alloacidobacterium dinghuense]
MRRVLNPSACFIAACAVFTVLLLTRPCLALETEQAKDTQTFVDSIGVNTHINYFDRLYGNFDLLKQRLEESGIRHVRDGAVLQNDAYNRLVYGRWKTLASFGVKFDMCFDPRGSIKQPSPEQISKLLDLAGGSVESIEGPNELDISKKPAWIDVAHNYQQALFTAAKQVPAATELNFVGPSMAFVKNAQRVGDISEFVTRGNLHTYAAGGMPDSLYAKQAQQATAMYGQKPLIVTETGYHNAMNNHGSQPPISEAAGAKYIPRLYFQSFNAGIEKTYLYEFFDEGNDPAQTNQEFHFGLVRYDGTPKPAFVAMRNLISILRDNSGGPASAGMLSYQISDESPNLAHTLLRKRNGAYYLAIWQEVPSYDTKTQTDLVVQAVHESISFPKAFRHINLYNPMESASPIQQWSKAAKVDVNIPDHVLVLEMLP